MNDSNSEHSWLDQMDTEMGFEEDLSEIEFADLDTQEIERGTKTAQELWGTMIWPATKKKCTCGAAAVGSGKHSTWCDLYEAEK